MNRSHEEDVGQEVFRFLQASLSFFSSFCSVNPVISVKSEDHLQQAQTGILYFVMSCLYRIDRSACRNVLA